MDRFTRRNGTPSMYTFVLPVIATLAHTLRIYEFASRSADLVFITPTDDDSLRSILGEIAQVVGTHLKVYADVVVSLGGDVDFRSASRAASLGRHGGGKMGPAFVWDPVISLMP